MFSHQEFKHAIGPLDYPKFNGPSYVKSKLKVCNEYFSELHKYLILNPDLPLEEEIELLKVVRTDIFGMKLFLQEMHKYLRFLALSQGQEEVLKAKLLESHDQVLHRHQTFVLYYLENATQYDEAYFNREGNEEAFLLHGDYILHHDTQCATPHSDLMATIRCSLHVKQFLQEVPISVEQEPQREKLDWNGKDVELVELCMSLGNYIKQNGKRTSLKTLVDWFVAGLNIEPLKHRQLAGNIRNRKERSLLLQQLSKDFEEVCKARDK